MFRYQVRKHLLALFLLTAFSTQATFASEYSNLSVDDAINIALENNLNRMISKQSLEMAEHQYKQALSLNWPEVNLNALARRLDENPTYEVDGLAFSVPTPFGNIPVDTGDLEFDLMDRDTGAISLDLTYPLYSGGLISAKQELAKIGADVASIEVRRTELDIVHDVEKYFSAVLLTSELINVVEDSTITLQIARDLAKAFLEGGSLSVDRREYLKAEIAVSLSESIYAQAIANNRAAIEALKFSMGISYDQNITINEEEKLPNDYVITGLDDLVNQAKKFNPELNKLNLAVVAGDALIKEAKSLSRPKVLFESSLTHLESNDIGLINSTNDESWSIQLSLQIPIFQGFRSKHAVSSAKVKQQQYKTNMQFAKKGVALSIKNEIIELDRANSTANTSKKAVEYAKTYSDLTFKSYQQRLVDIDELIESQIYKSTIISSHLKARHDISLHSSRLANIVGNELKI